MGRRSRDEIPAWMRESLNLTTSPDDEDIEFERFESCSRCGPVTFSWPLPGTTLLSEENLARKKLRYAKKVLRMKPLFPRFSELPFELRMEVWSRCQPVIPTSSRTIGFIADNDDHVRAFAKIPTLLHVNSETREEALKHYQLCFSEICGGRPVYIDFKIDRLYMYTARTFRCFFVEGRNGISNIALHMESKKFIKEARCLMVNCAATLLPEFLPAAGFKNLQMLVMPGEKHGNRQWRVWGGNMTAHRGWTQEREQDIKDNYRPLGDKSATEFELVILRAYNPYKHFFENMA